MILEEMESNFYFYPTSTGGFLPGHKTARACHGIEFVEQYRHSPIRLHDVVIN
jgi:hypothetical protein